MAKTIFLYYEKGNGDIYTSSLMERNGPRPYLWVLKSIPFHGKLQAVFLLMEIILFHQRQAERIWRTGYYVSTKLSNGAWGKAVNLGPEIQYSRK